MLVQMYDLYKSNNAACSNACRPVIIHAVFMTNIFYTLQAINRTDGSKKGKDRTKSSTLDMWT
jgi:uncharacterized membrane protein YwzB